MDVLSHELRLREVSASIAGTIRKTRINSANLQACLTRLESVLDDAEALPASTPRPVRIEHETEASRLLTRCMQLLPFIRTDGLRAKSAAVIVETARADEEFFAKLADTKRSESRSTNTSGGDAGVLHPRVPAHDAPTTVVHVEEEEDEEDVAATEIERRVVANSRTTPKSHKAAKDLATAVETASRLLEPRGPEPGPEGIVREAADPRVDIDRVQAAHEDLEDAANVMWTGRSNQLQLEEVCECGGLFVQDPVTHELICRECKAVHQGFSTGAGEDGYSKEVKDTLVTGVLKELQSCTQETTTRVTPDVIWVLTRDLLMLGAHDGLDVLDLVEVMRTHKQRRGMSGTSPLHGPVVLKPLPKEQDFVARLRKLLLGHSSEAVRTWAQALTALPLSRFDPRKDPAFVCVVEGYGVRVDPETGDVSIPHDRARFALEFFSEIWAAKNSAPPAKVLPDGRFDPPPELVAQVPLQRVQRRADGSRPEVAMNSSTTRNSSAPDDEDIFVPMSEYMKTRKNRTTRSVHAKPLPTWFQAAFAAPDAFVQDGAAEALDRDAAREIIEHELRSSTTIDSAVYPFAATVFRRITGTALPKIPSWLRGRVREYVCALERVGLEGGLTEQRPDLAPIASIPFTIILMSVLQSITVDTGASPAVSTLLPFFYSYWWESGNVGVRRTIERAASASGAGDLVPAELLNGDTSDFESKILSAIERCESDSDVTNLANFASRVARDAAKIQFQRTLRETAQRAGISFVPPSGTVPTISIQMARLLADRQMRGCFGPGKGCALRRIICGASVVSSDPDGLLTAVLHELGGTGVACCKFRPSSLNDTDQPEWHRRKAASDGHDACVAEAVDLLGRSLERDGIVGTQLEHEEVADIEVKVSASTAGHVPIRTDDEKRLGMPLLF
jgi:hypothetical protein